MRFILEKYQVSSFIFAFVFTILTSHSLKLQAQDINCSGGDTMLPLFRSWIDDLHSLKSQIKLKVDDRVNLSATGFDDFLDNKVNCVAFVREPFRSEIDRYIEKNNHPPFLFPIALGSFNKKSATHAIAIYVNADNPLNSIDLQQLDAIYSKSRARNYPRAITTWGDLGLVGEWKDKPIHAYSMFKSRDSGNPPGIMNFLLNRVLLGGDFTDQLIEVGDSKNTPALDMLVQKAKSDPYAIVFSGFNNQLEGTKNLLISEGYQPAIKGSLQTVADNSYPLTRRIYLMISSNDQGNLFPGGLEFLRYIASARAQKIVKDSSTSFLPFDSTQLSNAQEVLNCDSNDRFFQYRPLSLKHAKKYFDASGSISIVGYNDMDDMISRWNKFFSFYYPGIFFSNHLLSTRSAPEALMNEASLFAPMGANFEQIPLKNFINKFGHGPLTFEVAHNSLSPQALSGPIGILVHDSVSLDEIDLDTLKNIFTSTEKSNWVPYGLGETTALGQYMLKEIFHADSFSKQLQQFNQSRDVIAAVQKNPQGIAFASAQLPHPGLKFLKISTHPGEKAFELNRFNINQDLYPLDRKLKISVNTYNNKMDELAKNYLNLVASCVGQNQISKTKQQYIPLNRSSLNQLNIHINSY